MARILIVEDQKKLLQSLQRGLQEEGYEVVTAATGEDGYYFYSRSKIRVILVECTGSDYNTRESAGSSFVNPLIRREPP